MQEQEGQPDDVCFRLFERGEVQKHRLFILRKLHCNELLHLWLKINSGFKDSRIQGVKGSSVLKIQVFLFGLLILSFYLCFQ